MESVVPLDSQEPLYMLEDQFVSLHSPNYIIHAPLDTLGQFQRLKALLGSFNPSYGPLLINKSIISFLKGRKIYLRIYQLSLVLVFTRDHIVINFSRFLYNHFIGLIILKTTCYHLDALSSLTGTKINLISTKLSSQTLKILKYIY